MNGVESQEIGMFRLRDKILGEAKRRKTVLRILGGVAVRTHCPKYKYLHYKFRRELPDIDFAGHLKQVVPIQKLFLDLGFEEDKNVMRLFGTQRRIFDLPAKNIRSDIVLDKLHFCHDIDLKMRLEIDYPTISLADLLLSKLQIVELNEKDFLDIIMLLLEHKLGNTDNETINIEYISKLCARDWGLWRTVTYNLEKIPEVIERYLSEKNEVKNLRDRIHDIVKGIQETKKSISWKWRSKFGEKIKWYREVEELER